MITFFTRYTDIQKKIDYAIGKFLKKKKSYMPPNKYDFGKMSLKLEGNCKREGGPGHGYRK